MASTYSQPVLQHSPFGSSEMKAALLEPLLVVGDSAFWLVTLPFAAVSLCVVDSMTPLLLSLTVRFRRTRSSSAAVSPR